MAPVSERCRGCGRVLGESILNEPIARVSCACGFINLFERNITVLPLREEIERMCDSATADKLLADSEDPAWGSEVLERTFSMCLDMVRRAVAAAPPAAQAARWKLLVEFDRRSRRFRSGQREESYAMVSSARAAQILEAMRFERWTAPSDLAHAIAPARMQSFLDSFFPPATSAAALAQFVHSLRDGLLTAYIRNGVFELHKTPAHSRMQEWLLNRDRFERVHAVRAEDIFSDAASEAVELWLGFNPAIGREVFVNKHELLQNLAAHRGETVYAIPHDQCPEALRAIFERFTLTAERVRRFEVPFYWDLGLEPEVNGPDDLATRLGIRNWLVYYPILEGLVDGEPAFFVSAEALTSALAGLESFKNGMLQRITTRIAQQADGESRIRARINKLRVAANRRFEENVAERGRSLGFDVGCGLDRIDGKRLDGDGGEIDLFWAREHGGRLQLILGEVKDFDLVLHRTGSEYALRDKILKAEGQVERKAAMVRKGWRRLLAVVTDGRITDYDGQVILGKVLLASSYLPPHLSVQYPALTLQSVDEYLADLERWPEGFPPRWLEHGVETLS